MLYEGTSAKKHLTRLLVVTAIGVYFLIVIGATTALLSKAVACTTWPACNGNWVVPLTLQDPALLTAWLHRVATLIVGGLVSLTVIATWITGAPERIKYAIGITAILFPVQIILGAYTAINSAPIILTAIHLIVAMIIFTSILVALLWQLESENTTDDSIVSPDPNSINEGHESPNYTINPSSTGNEQSFSDRLKGYIELMKPKLMWLLCLVAIAAMGLAGGSSLNLITVGGTLLGGVLAIGASGTFNNIIERDVDRQMNRTNDRPLVEGRIPLRNAIIFGFFLTLASISVFLVLVNILAALLGFLAILFYSVVYTVILKPNTTQNIVIGGAVGAFPALIGWAAVTNTIGIPAIVLGTIIFLWTPAHFYNLALAYKEDYARGGFPMLPVVHGETTTRRHILLYFGATMISAVILGAITRLDVLYAVTATLLGAIFLWELIHQYQEQTEEAALRTFHASNVYLGFLLVAIAVDSIVI
ncbi:MAG: heme o synthase [Halobacteriaceae archaeon]